MSSRIIIKIFLRAIINNVTLILDKNIIKATIQIFFKIITSNVYIITIKFSFSADLHAHEGF